MNNHENIFDRPGGMIDWLDGLIHLIVVVSGWGQRRNGWVAGKLALTRVAACSLARNS